MVDGYCTGGYLYVNIHVDISQFLYMNNRHKLTDGGPAFAFALPKFELTSQNRIPIPKPDLGIQTVKMMIAEERFERPKYY